MLKTEMLKYLNSTYKFAKQPKTYCCFPTFGNGRCCNDSSSFASIYISKS